MLVDLVEQLGVGQLDLQLRAGTRPTVPQNFCRRASDGLPDRPAYPAAPTPSSHFALNRQRSASSARAWFSFTLQSRQLEHATLVVARLDDLGVFQLEAGALGFGS